MVRRALYRRVQNLKARFGAGKCGAGDGEREGKFGAETGVDARKASPDVSGCSERGDGARRETGF